MDVGEGLIFDLPEADMGVHPTEGGPASACASRSTVVRGWLSGDDVPDCGVRGFWFVDRCE